jgi:hypothetical protein
MNETLKQVLDSFETRTNAFTEFSVADALDKVSNDTDSDAADLKAEKIAFNLIPDYDGEGSWGTYYGPMMLRQTKDGQILEFPRWDSITTDVIAYWEQRAAAATHPLLSCRYSDIVWDFKRKVTQSTPDVKHAINVVDKTLALVTGNKLEYCSKAERLLTRSLSIAQSMKDQDRSKQVVDLILNLPDRIEDSGEKRQATVFAFDTLIGNKKVSLDKADQNHLIQQIEERLLHAAGGNDRTGAKDHFLAQDLATRLAEHYRKANQTEDIERVITLYGETALAAAGTANAIVASGWIRQVYDIYRSFGLNELANSLLVKLQDVSAGIEQEMKPISVKTEISAEEIEKVVAELTEGELCQVLRTLAASYVSDIEQAKAFVASIQKESITQNIFSQQIVDREGRVQAVVGPIPEDLDGHHILQLLKNMQFEGQIYRLAVERMMQKFSPTTEQIVQCIAGSPFLSAERLPLLQRGISAYLENDVVAAIHILIPQIESALRQLLTLLRQPVMKHHRNGGLMLKNLDEILRVPEVAHVLTVKIAIYLRTLLCDQRGWNLRNDVCHGIAEPSEFNQLVADRVFMAVILLGQFTSGPSVESPEESEEEIA